MLAGEIKKFAPSGNFLWPQKNRAWCKSDSDLEKLGGR